jgi:hypothetical protein
VTTAAAEAPPSAGVLAWTDRLLWAGYAVLAAGLFGPAFTLTPRLGEWTDVLRSAGVLEGPRTLSIAETVRDLGRHGEIVLFLVLGLTAFLVPVAKIGAYQEEVRRLREGLPSTRALRFADAAGRWAFTDVFAAALLVVRFKDVEAGPVMSLEWGFFAYAAAAVLAFAAGTLLRKARRTTATS